MPHLHETLPDTISDLFATATPEAIIVELSQCRVGARCDNYYEKTTLHIAPCPDEVVRWLVERGEDINAEDRYGRRPLHTRCRRSGWEQIPLLLSLGARLEATDRNGATALHTAAEHLSLEAIDILLDAGADPTSRTTGWGCENHSVITRALSREEDYLLPSMLEIIERLLAAGAQPSGAEAGPLRRLGKEHQRALARGVWNERIEARDTALNRLYEICGVEPVAPIHIHDGTSPIKVPAGRWRKAYSALWDSLVPEFGQAATAQGEAIRISGRIGNELLNNGGVNWDEAYDALTVGLEEILASGTPLPSSELEAARESLDLIRDEEIDEDAVDCITELAVAWVRLNPTPMPNPLPSSSR